MSFNGVEEVYCALYVDFDNIFTRLYELDPELAHEFGSNPKRWIRWIEGHAVKILYGEGVRRRILKRVCYLNPRRYQEYRSYFTMAAFQVVDCPPMTRQEKTSTDIHLVMDCLDALHHQTHFGEFIILSGDSDFTPLLLRLQEYARKTLVLSVGYTSPAYASAATWRIREDWFITQSLEKEENPDDDFDDYDMDNHYEMMSMSQYRAERERRLSRSGDGEHGSARHNDHHDSHHDDHYTNDSRYDKHDRSKRYDRKDRDSYEGRQSFSRDYQRQSFSTGRNESDHSESAQNSSYAYRNGQSGRNSDRNNDRNGRYVRDEWAAYSPKKYLNSPQYQRYQGFDEEESTVNIPVKVISYADVKKPSLKEKLAQSLEESGSSYLDDPIEFGTSYDEADALDSADVQAISTPDTPYDTANRLDDFAETNFVDADSLNTDLAADAHIADAHDEIADATDSESQACCSSSVEECTHDMVDAPYNNDANSVQSYDADVQGFDIEDENLEDEAHDVEDDFDASSELGHEDAPKHEDVFAQGQDFDYGDEDDQDNGHNEDDGHDDDNGYDQGDEPDEDDVPDEDGEPDEDDDYDEDEVNGNQVYHGLSNAQAQGYASYASTLRQHGYGANIHDYDDDLDDEVNGNIAEPTAKSIKPVKPVKPAGKSVTGPNVSEQAAEILRKVVTESLQPVPAANIGQILQRELGAGLDWFGFGKLRDFLDHLDLAPLEFSPVPPGYLYDPNRHDKPEERGNNDEFRNKYPELFDFALNVHRLTDMPLLLPEHYKQVLGYIVEEVNTNGFFMTTTSRNVRDRCIEDGLPVARSHVNFIIVGVGRGGCPLNDKQGISMRDVAKAFLRNAYDLCRVAHMELGEHTMHQLMEWIMPKE